MKLKVKDLNLSTGGPLVAVLTKEDAAVLDIDPLDRVKIRCLRADREVIAVVDISTRGIKHGTVGLFEEVMEKLRVEGETSVDVLITRPPESINFIRDKLQGKTLNRKQMFQIIDDVVHDRLSEAELTYFVSGCYSNGLNMDETTALTEAIVAAGKTLDLGKGKVLDKHAGGGVPNNRTTMIVTPIVAAAGFVMPKTSSRAITSPAGTADVVEVLAPVALSKDKLERIVKKTGACMAWGGSMNLAGADDKLIKVRHPLRLDPRGMLLASIMAKKKAVGATHVLIDLSVGKTAKFKTRKEAKLLGKDFVELGKRLGMKVKVVITDGSQPVGNGIGPSLEAADVIEILKGGGPTDLRNKAIFLATELLKLAGVKDAKQLVIEVLDSGKAFRKFVEIIQAQGGSGSLKLPKAKYFKEVLAKKSGTIKEIDNKKIAHIARLAGAPSDKVAGLYLRVKVGDEVKRGDSLFTLYAENKYKLENAYEVASRDAIMLY